MVVVLILILSGLKYSHYKTVYLDLAEASRPGLQPRRVSVDFPVWMVNQLDQVSKRLGITRQSVIKVFISEKLKEENL